MTAMNSVLFAVCIALGLLTLVFAVLWRKQYSSCRLLTKQIRQLNQANQCLNEDTKRLSTELVSYQQTLQFLQASKEKYILMGELIGLGNSPVDLLTEAQRILYYQDRISASETAENSINLFITLLRMIAATVNLQPIAAYHQIVKFDPLLYQGDHMIPPGTQVMVIETGWHIGDLIIKKAYVTMNWEQEYGE
jgi:uncharacterized membrane protein YciS (DUF1049 family)